MPHNTPPILTLRLLHLEDNPKDAEQVRSQLAEEWPACAIKRVSNREDYVAALHSAEFDLILSDFSLPAFNGLEALDLARQHGSATPFVFLSGTIGEDNAVEALRRGAADYVGKDRPVRLIPAIRNALTQRREHRLRRQAEQRLREQADLLDKARDAICVTDVGGAVTYWNQSAGALFGWHGTEGHGRRLQEIFGLFNQATIPEALRQLQASGAWSGEMQLALGDGTLRHIESRWTLVHDADHRPKSILLINTDITEQKKLEAQLLRAQRLEGIGTLAGGIAHDLNNVLSPILMSVQMLQMKLSDPGLLRLVGVLEQSAQQGAGLIRQVLAFARGAEGEQTGIVPARIMDEVVSLLSETLPRSIAVEADSAADPWMIKGNAIQLSQVLMNLGVNARDAMPRGGRLAFRARNQVVSELLASAHPGARPGPHVLITVADTGAGIPPDLLDRIFDPFFTTKAAGKGTGLGLSTVQGIIRSHRGFLQVQSEVNRGTEFSLYLPAMQTPAVPAPVPAPAVAAAPDSRGGTILVIDDESGVREITRMLLQSRGYRVLVADSGPVGLSLYRGHPRIDAVVTDMMMPGMQGGEVIAQLRSINPDARIVAMSGVIGEQTAVAEEAGRLVFLPKPMPAAALFRAVQQVLG